MFCCMVDTLVWKIMAVFKNEKLLDYYTYKMNYNWPNFVKSNLLGNLQTLWTETS